MHLAGALRILGRVICISMLRVGLVAAALVGCRQQQEHVAPDVVQPPAQAAPTERAPIVAPAPYWPPGPPEGTAVQEIGTWDRLGFLVGYQQFDTSWEPFADQAAFALTGTHEWRGAPLGIEWSAGYASKSSTVADVRTTNQNFELAVGPTRTFHLGGAKWFANLGLGLAWTYTEFGENTGVIGVQGQSDGWFAGYAHAALIHRLFPAWDIALDVRGVQGEDVELGDVSFDGRYWQIALGFGVGI